MEFNHLACVLFIVLNVHDIHCLQIPARNLIPIHLSLAVENSSKTLLIPDSPPF